MTCQQLQAWISGALETEAPEAVLEQSARQHAHHCPACAELLAGHAAMDAKLTAAFPAPALPPSLRKGVYDSVRKDKRARLRTALEPLAAPAAGLAVSGVCAWLAPELARPLLAAGLFLGGASYLAQLLFQWLTEELGEG